MKYILVALITISFAFGQGTINTDTDSKCGKIIDGIFYEEECIEPIKERVIIFGDILNDWIQDSDGFWTRADTSTIYCRNYIRWQPNQKLYIVGEGQELFGQDIEISLTPGVSLTNEEIRLHQLITFDNILDYAEECYADTLRLEKVGDEYLLRYEHYGEMFTERQLNKQGYFYQYRWIMNTIIDEEHPMELEYIFVKEPTLKGFIECMKGGLNE